MVFQSSSQQSLAKLSVVCSIWALGSGLGTIWTGLGTFGEHLGNNAWQHVWGKCRNNAQWFSFSQRNANTNTKSMSQIMLHSAKNVLYSIKVKGRPSAVPHPWVGAYHRYWDRFQILLNYFLIHNRVWIFRDYFCNRSAGHRTSFPGQSPLCF